MPKTLKGETLGRRSLLHVLFLHLGIRIRYLWDSWCFLKPLLAYENTGYTSPWTPSDVPRVSYSVTLGLRLIVMFGATFRNMPAPFQFLLLKLRVPHMLNFVYIWLQHRVAHQFKTSGYDWKKVRGMPVPEYDWKNGSPQEFRRLFVDSPHPVLLRGFAKEQSLVRQFTFDKILEKYGEEDILMSINGNTETEMAKLKLIDDPRNYIFASEVLLNKYPEFLNSLNTKRLEPYMGHLKESWSQFFMGRQGTGSSMHAASSINMFYMIDGTKKWYFVDPAFMNLTGPMCRMGNHVLSNTVVYPDEYNEDMNPAAKYVPYFTADVNAGDVLYNPAWWLHAIRNVSDKTVAISSRWVAGGEVGSNFYAPEEDYEINRWCSFMYLAGLRSYPFVQEILYEPSPSYDEHTTLRERRSRNGIAYELASGKIEVMGWKPHF